MSQPKAKERRLRITLMAGRRRSGIIARFLVEYDRHFDYNIEACSTREAASRPEQNAKTQIVWCWGRLGRFPVFARGGAVRTLYTRRKDITERRHNRRETRPRTRRASRRKTDRPPSSGHVSDPGGPIRHGAYRSDGARRGPGGTHLAGDRPKIGRASARHHDGGARQ